VEFLEFWVWEDAARVAQANGTTVLFDFGGIFEDALAFTPTSFTVSAAGDTTYAGVRRTGAGRLDDERDPRTHTWSATLNDEGILSDRVVDGIVDSTRGVVIDTLPLCSPPTTGKWCRTPSATSGRAAAVTTTRSIRKIKTVTSRSTRPRASELRRASYATSSRSGTRATSCAMGA